MGKDEELRQITKHFGIETELMKLTEEVGELLNACYKTHLSNASTEDIEDEMADVMVILQQIVLYFDVDVSLMDSIARQKIDRTVKRINDGWYDRHR